MNHIYTDHKFEEKYFQLLKSQYPTIQDASTEIINLEAILSLPKGTEHFMSDIHGEFEAFYHIMNNCSGVIKEKVDLLYADQLNADDRQELCTLIYYPDEKLMMLKKEKKLHKDWYRITLIHLIELTTLLSSKYTRSKVRKALPKQFGYIIDELLHSRDSQDLNISSYQNHIIDTIIDISNADAFIKELVELIKHLAVDHLHIIGDIFDRGDRADGIIDLLMKYHSLDIQWGNHDVLWMGAAKGNQACIATVLYNNLRYHNHAILENGYGISLRKLITYANDLYACSENAIDPVIKSIAVIMFKLEGQLIMRNPDFQMQNRLLLEHLDLNHGTITINHQTYQLKDKHLLTVNISHPYESNYQEQEIIDNLVEAFQNSMRLQKHIQFLCQKGSVYKVYNGNLLYHGCIPFQEDGNFASIKLCHHRLQGKKYLDFIDSIVRHIMYDKNQSQYLDMMYFFWRGELSPFSGRVCKTFERFLINEEAAHCEPSNPYYHFFNYEKECNMILHEFNLFSPYSHIINGHLPIRVKNGETPLKANGKLIMIDGGFCKAYQKKTGIAGYTLIYNSHGLRMKAHGHFENRETACLENKDITSKSQIIETYQKRMTVKDSDNGKMMNDKVKQLKRLLSQYIAESHYTF